MARNTARRLRENWIEFPQQFKIFIDANDRPQISSPTDPIWNLVGCVPFDVQIPDHEIDTDLPRKPDLEAPGILKWLVDGARIFIQTGVKNFPPEVAASTKGYRDASDRLKDFVAARCNLNPNAWVSSAALMAAYHICAARAVIVRFNNMNLLIKYAPRAALRK